MPDSVANDLQALAKDHAGFGNTYLQSMDLSGCGLSEVPRYVPFLLIDCSLYKQCYFIRSVWELEGHCWDTLPLRHCKMFEKYVHMYTHQWARPSKSSSSPISIIGKKHVAGRSQRFRVHSFSFRFCSTRSKISRLSVSSRYAIENRPYTILDSIVKC